MQKGETQNNKDFTQARNRNSGNHALPNPPKSKVLVKYVCLLVIHCVCFNVFKTNKDNQTTFKTKPTPPKHWETYMKENKKHQQTNS